MKNSNAKQKQNNKSTSKKSSNNSVEKKQKQKSTDNKNAKSSATKKTNSTANKKPKISATIKNALHVKSHNENGNGTLSQNLGLRILIITLALLFVIIFAFSAIVLIVGGLFSQREYLSVWDKTYYTQFEDDRLKLVSHGILAPNNYNMQPWQIKLDTENENIFYLYANTDRLFSAADTKASKTMISLGTFLEYLAVAGEHLGLQSNFEYFPNGELDESNLLSSLKETPIVKITCSNSDIKLNALYEHLFKPATNRSEYTDEKLPTSIIKEFNDAITHEKIKLSVYQNQEDISRISEIIMQAIKTEVNLPEVMNERGLIFQTNNFEKNKNKYGVSLDNYGDKGIILAFKQGIVTLFPNISKDKNAQNEVISKGEEHTSTMPNVIIIKTIGNERVSQIEAGRQYAKVVLMAHEKGYTVQPMSYPIQDIEELKDSFNAIHEEFAGEGNKIQMLFRIGKPTKNAVRSARITTDKIIMSK